MSKLYIVTGSYATVSGGQKHFRFEYRVNSAEEALARARARLVGDRRYRYEGKLDMKAS